MANSVSLHILRSPFRTFLYPHRSSSSNLLTTQLSPSPLITSRKSFGVFHTNCSNLFAFMRKNEEAKSDPKYAAEEEDLNARGESAMPERFRYLYKEVPDLPVRWPWAIALFFLVYAWRTVLWELLNWKNAAIAIISSFGWLLKLTLAFVFRWIGDPITSLIQSTEFVLYTIKYFYASIIAFTPVPELTRIILFTSTILAIAEATVPDSVNSQPYILTLSGLIGFGAVKGFISEFPFWIIFFGMIFYSKFIKKRDILSAALPSAALLAGVGEPWVRGIVITSYLALAIAQHAKYSNDGNKVRVRADKSRLPLPLLLASLTIGINLAAKWIRYRHLTWMIV